MIKIEITGLKDLRGVEKQNYWRHVGKKAVFLLDTSLEADNTILKSGNTMFYDAALRINNTPNLKPITSNAKL